MRGGAQVTANMLLIAFGVVVCAFGELNLVLKGLMTQLAALVFEVRSIAAARRLSRAGQLALGSRRPHCHVP